MTRHLDSIRRPTDSAKMKAAIDWLEKQGLSARRPTEWQLKVGPINFYPDRGTIICDGEVEPLQQRGLAAFGQLLARDNDHPSHIVMLPLNR